MPDFKYRGLLKDGKTIRGIIPAQTRLDVIEKLKKSMIQPVIIKKVTMKNTQKISDKEKQRMEKQQLRSVNQLKKVNTGDKSEKKGMTLSELMKAEVHPFTRIKQTDIITFMNNLYILKKAKFNNIQALKSLYEGTENPAFRDIIEDILIGVEQGQRMYSVMLNYPKVFPPMVVNFIRVGEESGTLDTALMYARDYIESSINLKKKIRSTLIPKIVQFLAIVILMFVALIFGVPMLQNVYDMFNSDKEIPKATQMALVAAEWLLGHWVYIVSILAVIIVAFEIYIHTAKGRYNWDKLKLTFPVIGNLLTSITISNFFQAMLLNLKNGMRIKEALEISKGVSKNYYFLSIVEVAKNRSLVGESWITPFQERKIFNPMVTEMLSIGMQTDLAEMMSKVNEYIEMQIDESVGRFVRWLPDVTYAIVGVMLIIFVIVVLVPIIEVYMGSFISY